MIYWIPWLLGLNYVNEGFSREVWVLRNKFYCNDKLIYEIILKQVAFSIVIRRQSYMPCRKKSN